MCRDMDNLSEDLLVVEILSRLPLKSLMHVGGVCKPWRSVFKVILSNPNFVKLHKLRNPDDNNNNNNNESFIAHYFPKNKHECHKLCVINMNFLNRPPIKIKLPFNISIKPEDFNVVGSCNGLLCIAYMRKKKPRNSLLLWNPVTGQLKDIHKYTIGIKYENCHVSLGFGFDKTSADYKVVRIVRDLRKGSPSDTSRVEVYSLNKDAWKEIDVEFAFRVRMGSFCVTVKGLFYWLTGGDDFFLGLISFDVQSEEFQPILLPDGITSVPDIFNLKESLAIAIHYPGQDTCSIQTLDHDNNTWIKMHTLKGPSEIRFIVGGLNTDKFVGETVCGKLLLCDHLKKEVKLIHHLPECTLKTYDYTKSTIRIHNHCASLALLY